MGTLAEKVSALAEGFADQPEFRVLQVAQASVDNPGGAARGAGGKIVLLDEQGSAAGSGALAGNGDAIDATADHDDREALAFQWLSRQMLNHKGRVIRADWMLVGLPDDNSAPVHALREDNFGQTGN